MASTHRPDIDGLRAIAVLSVIAYHLSLPGIPSGFLGVDVFFVISGYLITTIIRTEIDENRFTLVRFFERRIRRIVPALLMVLAASTVVACVLLLPHDLSGFARSQVATLFFFANVYFWRDTNYFSSAAEEKPLLHMWSLGVEEQFYIIFPLLLLLVIRRTRWNLVLVLITVVLLSFSANVGLNAIGGRNPAFFLLPTRAWELGVGSVLAVVHLSRAPQPWVAQAIGLAGIALIAIGLSLPNIWAGPIPQSLSVVTGTAMVIWSGTHRETFARRCLALGPLQIIGKMSYSMYLWHWPIIVFATYYLVRDLGNSEKVIAALLTLGCAAVSLRFVEGPFRSKRLSFASVGLIVGAASLVLLIASAFILRTGGLPGRLPQDAALLNAAVGTNYRCAILDYVPLGEQRACRLNLLDSAPSEAELVLFGNSHAQMYAPLIRDITVAQDVTSILLPMNGCLPMVDVNISTGCAAQAARNLETILAMQNVSRVVIAFNWEIASRELVNASGSVLGSFDEAISAGLDNTLSQLEGAGIEPILVGPIPVPGYELASELSRSLAFGHVTDQPQDTSYPEFSDRYAAISDPLRDRLGTRFIEVHPAICTAATCDWIIDGRSIFSDANHVAQAELWRFRPFFDSTFDE